MRTSNGIIIFISRTLHGMSRWRWQWYRGGRSMSLNGFPDGLGGGLKSWIYLVEYFDNRAFLFLLPSTLCELDSLGIDYVTRNQSCLSFSCFPGIFAHLLKVGKVNQTYRKTLHRNKDHNTPLRPLCWKGLYFRQSIDISSAPDQQEDESIFRDAELTTCRQFSTDSAKLTSLRSLRHYP